MTVHPFARIIHPGVVSLGSDIVIDDFVFVGRHEEVVIGSHVHIASHASITGGGRCILGDFCGVSSGARILSGTDVLVGGTLTGPTVPDHLRSVDRSEVVIGRHAVIGSNAVVLPGVVVGTGAIVGAGSVVRSELEPWSVNVGQPTRKVGNRDPEPVLMSEQRLMEERGNPESEVPGPLGGSTE